MVDVRGDRERDVTQVRHGFGRDVHVVVVLETRAVGDRVGRPHQEPLEQTIVEGQDVVLAGLVPPLLDELGDDLGVLAGKIVTLADVVIEVLQLPLVIGEAGVPRSWPPAARRAGHETMSGSRTPPPCVLPLYRFSGVLATIAQPVALTAPVSGPPT